MHGAIKPQCKFEHTNLDLRMPAAASDVAETNFSRPRPGGPRPGVPKPVPRDRLETKKDRSLRPAHWLIDSVSHPMLNIFFICTIV